MTVRIPVSVPRPSSDSNNRFAPQNVCRFLLFVLFLPSLTGLCNIPAVSQDVVVLVGSGSSVPAPLYSRWAQEYGKRSSRIQMHYLPVGTSEGIKQIAHGTGDFSAGEALLTAKERKEGSLIELPAVLIGIVPIYNLPDIHQELRLSGEVLAEIFLGELKPGTPLLSASSIRTCNCPAYRFTWSTGQRERAPTMFSLISFPR